MAERDGPQQMGTSRSKWKPLIIAVMLVTLDCILAPRLLAQQDVHASLIPAAERKVAPSFHLISNQSKTVQIRDFRGRVVLLNFWATACGGCILEIPSFIEIQHAYESRGFTAVGISTDVAYEGLKNVDQAWKRVRPFMESHAMNYPVLMGEAAVVNAYGFKSYPATYLIDKSGRIAATYVGVVSKDDVEANIKKLLSER
jgi:peroxiredoxin